MPGASSRLHQIRLLKNGNSLPEFLYLGRGTEPAWLAHHDTYFLRRRLN